MKNTLTLCIPTLNRYDLLTGCIVSALKGSEYPKKVSLIDNGNALPDRIYKALKEWCCDTYDSEMTVYTPANNIGVAKSWNWFMSIESFPMLICNDDIEFGFDDIKMFEHIYYSSESSFFFTDNVDQLNMFSCFMPTYELIRKVGYFDDTFYPAYYEDNDYAYRMSRKHIELQAIKTNIKHFGSATIRQYTPEQIKLHHEQFKNNRQYYSSKWGGEPGEEIYINPFNKVVSDD